MILKAMEWTILATLAVMGLAAVVVCAVMLWREYGWWAIPLAWIGISFGVALTTGLGRE